MSTHKKTGLYVISGYRSGVKIGVTRDLDHRVGKLQAEMNKAVRLCFGNKKSEERVLKVDHFEAMDWESALRVESLVHRDLKIFGLDDELFSIPSSEAVQAVLEIIRSPNGNQEHRTLEGVSKSGRRWTNNPNWYHFCHGKWPADLVAQIKTAGKQYGSITKFANDAIDMGLDDLHDGHQVASSVHRGGDRFQFWVRKELMSEVKSVIVPRKVTINNFVIWSLSRMCEKNAPLSMMPKHSPIETNRGKLPAHKNRTFSAVKNA